MASGDMNGATLFAKLIDALCTAPISIADLTKYTGLDRNTVRRYLKALRETGHVYIAHMEEDSRGRLSVAAWSFTIEPREDAPRTPLPKRVLDARYNAKRRNRDRVFLMGSQP